MDHVQPELQSALGLPFALRQYLLLTKPGIVAGNTLSAGGGLLLACRGAGAPLGVLLSLLTGIALIVAAGCVFNNCIDRRADRMMARTRGRALAAGRISPAAAVAYGLALVVIGFGVMAVRCPAPSAVAAALGLVIYVVVYSLYLKPRSVHAALVGSLAGAAPPVAGYCAAGGGLDAGTAIVAVLFACWQMPHFYAIAVYRMDDYAAAAIPVLPVCRGVAAAKRHSCLYAVAFFAAAFLLYDWGYAGERYLLAVVTLAGVGAGIAWTAYRAGDDRRWARRSFVFSLAAIGLLTVMMAVDAMPPFPTPVAGAARAAPR